MRERVVVVLLLLLGSLVAAVAGRSSAMPCAGTVVKGEPLPAPPAVVASASAAAHVAVRTGEDIVAARFARGTLCGDRLVVGRSAVTDRWYAYRGKIRYLVLVSR